jgi:hypothetical protein
MAFPRIEIYPRSRPLEGDEDLVISQGGVLRKTSTQEIADLAVSDDVTLAGELFVAKNGSDTAGTGSLSKPLATIGAALTAASANYLATDFVRINVAPGEYPEALSITRHRTSIVGSDTTAENRATRVGPITVNCASATQKYNDTVAIANMLVESNQAQPALKVTGTGLFTVDVSSVYVTTGQAAQNAVLCDASNVGKVRIYMRNCVVTKQSSATADVMRFRRGDIRVDSTQVYASISGTGNGISFENDAVGLLDRVLVDISTTGAAVRANLAFATATPPVVISNSSLASNAAGSPCLQLANTLSLAALVWQTIFTKPLTGAGEYAITGTSNGSTLTLLSGNMAFTSNSTINGVTRVGMTVV